MRLLRFVAVTVLTSSLVIAANGQDVVGEAKANLETKHHKALVDKAEKLLEQKKEYEAKLAKIDRQLADLAAGKDVKIDEEPSSGTVIWPTGGTTCCYIHN